MKKTKFVLILQLMLVFQYAYSISNKLGYSTFDVRVTGSGTVVILIHGIGCSAEVWSETVKVLSEHYECHVLQIKGFAGNPMVPDFQFCNLVKEIIKYIKDNHLKKVTLIGHSIGGLLALRINILEPGLVDKTIIIDTYPSPLKAFMPTITQQQELAQAEALSDQIESFSSDQFATFIRNSLLFSVTDTMKLNEIINWYKLSDRKTLANAYKNYLSTDLADSLSQIQQPILLLATCGSLKPMGISEEKIKDNLQNQYKNVKQCTIKISEKGRHFIMYDDFNWMITNIEDFLKN